MELNIPLVNVFLLSEVTVVIEETTVVWSMRAPAALKKPGEICEIELGTNINSCSMFF